MLPSKRSPRKKLLLLSLGAVLLGAPAAAQDIAAAEALFDRGLADMKAGRYETGCKAIAESQRIDPRAGTLFTLATCEAEWGHVATAFSRYGDYLAVYESLPAEKKPLQGDRPAVATEQRAKLGPEVPRLTLTLQKGTPTGTVVKRDGEIVGEAALGIALPVDPGEHVLTVVAPNGAAIERRITLQKGEKKDLTLDLGPAAPGGASSAAGPRGTAIGSPPLPVDPPAPGPSGRRVATYVVGAAGIVGLVAGGVLGALTAAQKGTIDAHCGAGIGSSDDTACDKTGLDAASGARGMGLGSTIALAVGGVAVGAAVVLLVTEPAKPKMGARRGPWVSAGVLSAGPAGAHIGVRGAW